MLVKAFSDYLLSLKVENDNQIFLSDRHSDLSYGDFILRVKRTCISLQSVLKREQSIVFLIAKNSSAFVTFIFALNYLRQIVVPVSPDLPARDLIELVATYRPSLILIEEGLGITELDAPGLTLESILRGGPESLAGFPAVKHHPEDVCFIMLTSGARNPAKGAVLTNSNILVDLKGINGYMNLSSADKCLIVRSLTHASALVGELLLTAMTRGTCVLRDIIPTLQRLFSWCKDSGVTWMGIPPIISEGLVRTARKQLLNLPLRRVVVSGSILSADSCLAFCDTFPEVELVNAYGLTEASPRVSYLPPELARVKPGGVGYAIEGCRIRLGRSDGTECSPGELGEVQVAGGNVMLGYFPLEHTSAQVISDGWLHTGDQGYMDSDGCLFITRRLDTMIVHRGVNISPEYVCSIIEECESVIKAEVVQVRHPQVGARLVSFVQVEREANPVLLLKEIRKYLSLNLDARKHPEEFIFIEAFPTTSSGKILVKKLVGEYLKGSGLPTE